MGHAAFPVAAVVAACLEDFLLLDLCLYSNTETLVNSAINLAFYSMFIFLHYNIHVFLYSHIDFIGLQDGQAIDMYTLIMDALTLCAKI